MLNEHCCYYQGGRTERQKVIEMWSDMCNPQLRFLSSRVNPTHKPTVTEEQAFPGHSCPAGVLRAAVAFTLEKVTQTPRCFVQMELTGDWERGIKRIGMCSSVKLKVVQHDIQHYVLGLVKSNN